MNKDEATAILSIIRTAYPAFYKNMPDDDIDDTINLWSMMFAEDHAKIVTEAVKALITTCKFPPTIAEVKEKISLITQPAAVSEMEAWGMVLKAIQNANYRSQEYFNDFPPVIRQIIGSPNQLREWAMTENLNMEVVSSNFMRSYTARVKADKEYQALPDSTKEMIVGIRAKMLDIGKGVEYVKAKEP